MDIYRYTHTDTDVCIYPVALGIMKKKSGNHLSVADGNIEFIIPSLITCCIEIRQSPFNYNIILNFILTPGLNC